MSQYVIDEDKDGNVIVVLNNNTKMLESNLQTPAFYNVKTDKKEA